MNHGIKVSTADKQPVYFICQFTNETFDNYINLLWRGDFSSTEACSVCRNSRWNSIPENLRNSSKSLLKGKSSCNSVENI